MTDSRVPSLGSWCDKGACKGMSEIFYSDFSERPNKRAKREHRAKAICGVCPVILQCRAYARANPEYGVWGGETEEERHAQGFPVPAGSKADQKRRVRLKNRKEILNEHLTKA